MGQMAHMAELGASSEGGWPRAVTSRGIRPTKSLCEAERIKLRKMGGKEFQDDALSQLFVTEQG